MGKSRGASARHIRRHWKVLCEEIGIRAAGSRAEQRAADYIEDQFRRLGLENVHQHRFVFPGWRCTTCAVRAGRAGKLKPIRSARPMVYGRSTPAGGARGRLVYLQTGRELDFRQDTEGKIGLLIGSLGLGDPIVKKRVLDARLAALLAVDARVAYGWPISLGAAPQWVAGYTLPTVAVPYFEAVELVKAAEKGPVQVEVAVGAKTFPAESQNVIGEIVGRERPEQVILVSGHHDSVDECVGADDNASGVVFTLELARLFAAAGRRPRRTIRFVSYGVEERLSVGSYLYMRALSRRQLTSVVLAVNADNIAGHVGDDFVIVTGTPALERLARQVWAGRKHPASIERGTNWSSDQFPFNIAGVGSVRLGRNSTPTGGNWKLHSAHDNLENASVPVIRRTIDSTAALLQRAANAPRLPFKTGIAPDLMKEVRAVGKHMYHHPWSVDEFEYV
ncbi:MAG: M28 family peptidase [Kiritimatiellae bacterium]|nr:M28 family peptidase [Kiritimatiellia bacterium]